MAPAKTFGEKINRLRKAKKLTLEQLATLTESSKSYIWELENKNPPRPSADKLSRIAKELDTTIEYLLDDDAQVRQADAADEMFFRKYQSMDASDKIKIQKMIDLWQDE